jgi:hypothetical protein
VSLNSSSNKIREIKLLHLLKQEEMLVRLCNRFLMSSKEGNLMVKTLISQLLSLQFLSSTSSTNNGMNLQSNNRIYIKTLLTLLLKLGQTFLLVQQLLLTLDTMNQTRYH